MSESNLRYYLWSGREVQFSYNSDQYVIKKIGFRSTDEYSFGKKWGAKYTFYSINEMLFCSYFGTSLSTMLSNASSVCTC